MSEDLVFQNLKEQKKNAQAFIKRWEGRGNERQDSQSFWLDLLQSFLLEQREWDRNRILTNYRFLYHLRTVE